MMITVTSIVAISSVTIAGGSMALKAFRVPALRR